MSDVKRDRKPDTRKGDRHRPGYWIEYSRKRRAREKEERLSTLTPSKANLPTPLKVKNDE